jgi:peptidoglycan/LPS O-acetylase OafA/YrhL
VTLAGTARRLAGTARRLDGTAQRIDAATPAGRDRAVDALRALAIAGVVLGHWLVTALVLTRGSISGRSALRDASPLAAHPGLAPLSWAFQTLAVFFLVGGYSAARSYAGQGGRDGGYLAWLRRRLARLGRPALILAACWLPAAGAMLAAGVAGPTVRTAVTLVLSPLWFLAVFAGLTALTPLAAAAVRRLRGAAALPPLAVVAAADAIRFWLHGPAAVGWVNLAAGWLVPYLIGMAWAGGAFRRATGPLVMLIGGAAATAALIGWAGYPAAMVGVNGAPVSNLNPPTLAAVTFGIAQAGLALLARRRLAAWMRRPLAWAAVAAVNLSAMTLFLWHQTALLAVTMTALAFGRLPGLHAAPSALSWIYWRLAWLPAFAAVLAGLLLLFRRAEHPRAEHLSTLGTRGARHRGQSLDSR